MKFKSKKDKLFSLFMLGLNAFLMGITIYGLITGTFANDEYWAILLMLAAMGLIFWIYFGTNYELSTDGFIYRSGPINGKISIHRITEIIKGKTLWIGFRPATSRNGLIVKYDKYNEIYISPKTNDAFIKEILTFNNNIKITE